MAKNNFSLDKLAVGGGSGTLVSGYRSSRVRQSRPYFFDVIVLLIQFMVTEALIGQLQPLRSLTLIFIPLSSSLNSMLWNL
jgi:hypothetical protein